MSDDLTTRARAIWHDMKYEEDPLAALIKALRDEWRRDGVMQGNKSVKLKNWWH